MAAQVILVHLVHVRVVVSQQKTTAAGVSSVKMLRISSSGHWRRPARGAMTGVKDGTAKITVYTEDGDFSASCKVTVGEDIMTITNRGVVATIKITAGTVSTDDKVKMIQPSDSYKNYNLTIGQLEMFRKVVEWAGKNDNAGIMFSESPKLKKSAITRGALIMGGKTERVVAVKKVYGTLALNDSRKTPIFPGYTPQLFSGNIDNWVTLSDLAGEDNLMPKTTYDNIGFTAKEGNKS